MISPEILRYYPFFGGLTSPQLVSIAMIATEENYPANITLFEKGRPSEYLYFLENGCVDLYFTQNGGTSITFPLGIPVGEVNPGEAFGTSALIEPYVLTSTARVSKPSRVIKIDAKALRALFKSDKRLAFLLTRQAAQAFRASLEAARVHLAAAYV